MAMSTSYVQPEGSKFYRIQIVFFRVETVLHYLRFSTSCISRLVSSLFRHFQVFENVEIKMKLFVKYNLLKNADNKLYCPYYMRTSLKYFYSIFQILLESNLLVTGSQRG